MRARKVCIEYSSAQFRRAPRHNGLDRPVLEEREAQTCRGRPPFLDGGRMVPGAETPESSIERFICCQPVTAIYRDCSRSVCGHLESTMTWTF